MKTFNDYLDTISSKEHRQVLNTIFAWISQQYPDLKQKIAWNQPMYTDHDTFIIGFSVAKDHFNLSPEIACLNHFADAIDATGYHRTKMLIQIRWDQSVDYDLLSQLIEYNIQDKKDCQTFWRK